VQAKPITALKAVVARPREQSDQPVILSAQKKRSAGPAGSLARKSPGQGELTLAQQLGLGVRKIVIDPGHGGKDPGAMAFGLKEKDIVLKVAKKVANILKTAHRYEVALTRNKDTYLALEERTAMANTQSGDLFISIHVNAHPDKTIGGIETYFLNLATNADAMRVAAMENATSTHNISELEDILNDLMKNAKIDESSRLARFVQTNLVNGMGKKYRARDLGVKQAPFYVLIGAEMPAVLAEISFITNPKEAELLRDDRYLNRIAEQIAAGIVAYVEHNQTAALTY
jgi:N-acetylmuramoyl-L-alanine amidase